MKSYVLSTDLVPWTLYPVASSHAQTTIFQMVNEILIISFIEIHYI
jgi:hypothetical protein